MGEWSRALSLACVLTWIGGAGATAQSDANVPLKFGGMSYPPVARAARVEGAVVVRAKVDVDGTVRDASAVTGPGLLVDAALASAKRWTFKPGSARDVVLTFLFELDGFCDTYPAPTIMSVRAPFDVTRVISCHGWTQ